MFNPLIRRWSIFFLKLKASQIQYLKKKPILDYLKKNPDAGDTLVGITEWWLESERVDQSVEEVSSVLGMLLKKGLIKKIKYENGNVIYKLSKR